MKTELEPELIHHLKKALKENNFSIKLLPFADSFDVLVTKENVTTQNHHICNFLLHPISYRFTENVRSKEIYKEFNDFFLKELKSLPHQFLSQLYAKCSNSFSYSYLQNKDLAVQFLTHPKTLEKINLKNISKYCKFLSPTDLYLFIGPLMKFKHLDWPNKKEDIQGFLEKRKYFHAVQKVFQNGNKKPIIQEIISDCVFFKMDFGQLAQSEQNSRHSFSDINKLTNKLISHFNAKKPDDNPIEEILADSFSSTGIKKIMVFSKNELYCQCFFEVFIDNINNILKKTFHLGGNNYTEAHNKPLKIILQETQSLYDKEYLEKQLDEKPKLNHNNKI